MPTKTSKFYFSILTTSGVPIYRQIIDQVKTLIATGRLLDGVFLPSVRQVASELEINPMTVSKAYSLLEKEGVLEYVRGQGMKIQGKKEARQNHQRREEDMAPLLREVIIKAQQLSLDPVKVVGLLESLWEDERHA
jgi:GntR family transcriptional regulator